MHKKHTTLKLILFFVGIIVGQAQAGYQTTQKIALEKVKIAQEETKRIKQLMQDCIKKFETIESDLKAAENEWELAMNERDFDRADKAHEKRMNDLKNKFQLQRDNHKLMDDYSKALTAERQAESELARIPY